MNEANKIKSNFVAMAQAVSITGLSGQTLRELADREEIACYRTPGGTRRFSVASLREMCGNAPQTNGGNDGREREKLNFIYARVSTSGQVGDLARQIEYLRSVVESRFGDHFDIVQDVASGLNFKRRGLRTILDACLQNRIGTVAIAHRDRLCRFAYDLVEHIVVRAGGQVVVCDDSNKHITREQELADDLLSIVHVYSCRQLGRRRYARKKGPKGASETSTTAEEKASGEHNDESGQGENLPDQRTGQSSQVVGAH
jgi:putative resolvase